jgi:branched-chain amino acid transport system substrate-binding protein
MRLRLSAVSALILVLSALVVTACGSSSSSSSAGGASASGGSTSGAIKLGAWFPLTGEIAATGIPQSAGATAYFKQLNAQGGVNGKQVQYLVKDNAYDPAQTIQVARDLVSQGVVAFVASNGTAPTQATFPYLFGQAKVPVLLPYGGLSTWYSPPKPLLYGFQAPYQAASAEAGAWAAENGAKNIVVIRDDPAAFAVAGAPAGPGAKSVNPSVKVSTVVVKFGTTDYSPVVAQVKGMNPDAVILILPFTEAASYLKTAQLQGLKAPAYSYTGTADEGLIKLAGSAAEGFHTLALTLLPDATGAAMDQYRAAMSQYEPGVAPSLSSVATYGAAMAVGNVLKTIHGPITASSIANAFANAGTVTTGILPPLHYSSSQHLGTSQMVRVVVKNGKFTAVSGFITPPAVSASSS